MSDALAGTRVVVIGGSEGIGLAVAQGALAGGAAVVVASRSAEKLAKARALLVAETGPGGAARVATQVLDITDEIAVEAAFAGIGAFDHLVISAVTPAFAPLQQMSNAAAERVLATKFWGTFWAVKYGSQRIAPTGSITLYGGLAAHRTGPGEAVLAFAQGGMEAFARALAVELAPVRVNCVCPGVTVTPLWDAFDPALRDAIYEETRASLPARRIADPADAAEPALYLMRSRFTTGEVIVVDGGARLV